MVLFLLAEDYSGWQRGDLSLMGTVATGQIWLAELSFHKHTHCTNTHTSDCDPFTETSIQPHLSIKYYGWTHLLRSYKFARRNLEWAKMLSQSGYLQGEIQSGGQRWPGPPWNLIGYLGSLPKQLSEVLWSIWAVLQPTLSGFSFFKLLDMQDIFYSKCPH